jgi:hypothetical protein
LKEIAIDNRYLANAAVLDHGLLRHRTEVVGR